MGASLIKLYICTTLDSRVSGPLRETGLMQKPTDHGVNSNRRLSGRFAFLLAAFACLGATSVWADLQPMDDEELADTLGQAFLSIDKTSHPVDNNVGYTRINLGMDIETKLNAETLELGRYARNGETQDADILIEDFGLGYIHNDRFFRDNNFISRMKGDYAEGDIVPFQITDPYVEFAFDESTNEMIGVRLGFGEAMGMMTGNIKSMTGNVNVAIRDTARGIREAHDFKTRQPDYQIQPMDDLLSLLTPYLVGGSPIEAPAELANTSGQADPVRATHIGMLNGSDFIVKDVNKLIAGPVQLLKPFLSSNLEVQGCSGFFDFSCDLYIESMGCEMLGIDTCFPLSNFKNLPIGKLSADRKSIVAPASGMFLSFQSRDGVSWSTTRNATDASQAQDFMNTTMGAFFNVPNGVLEVNLSQVYKPPVPAARQEYINRGVGLF